MVVIQDEATKKPPEGGFLRACYRPTPAIHGKSAHLMVIHKAAINAQLSGQKERSEYCSAEVVC